jgi:TonB family protein
MAGRSGRCVNDLYCSLASSGQDIQVPREASFLCPQCGKPLSDAPAGRAAFVPTVALVAGAGLAAAGAVLFVIGLVVSGQQAARPVVASKVPSQPIARTAAVVTVKAPEVHAADTPPHPAQTVAATPMPSAPSAVMPSPPVAAAMLQVPTPPFHPAMLTEPAAAPSDTATVKAPPAASPNEKVAMLETPQRKALPAPPTPSPDQAAREKLALEKAARDDAARESAAAQAAKQRQAELDAEAKQQQAARDQAAKDQLAREKTRREQAARDKLAKDQAARDQAAKLLAQQHQVELEQAARIEAAQQQAAAEQAAREREAKQAKAASDAAAAAARQEAMAKPSRGFSAHPISGGAPDYPAVYEGEGRAGRVTVSCTIDPQGRAKGCRVINSAGGVAFGKSVTAWLASGRVRFAPVIKDGAPVSVTQTWNMDFQP